MVKNSKFLGWIANLKERYLEKVIHEFNLYAKEQEDLGMEEVVELMRKKININVQGRTGAQTTFSVSFEGNDPVKVMTVTNKLADLFIQENLRTRKYRRRAPRNSFQAN